MSMQFVNVRGEPIELPDPVKRKVVRKEARDAFHKGWRAVGFSPAQIEKARLEHQASIQDAAAAGTPPPEPWSETSYMRRAKPKAIRSKPYEIHSSALECVELAERAGWKGCLAVPVAKGGKE